MEWDIDSLNDYKIGSIRSEMAQIKNELIATPMSFTTMSDTLYKSYLAKKIEPFIVIYKSKPIRGIILELWGKNPEYNWEVEEKIWKK